MIFSKYKCVFKYIYANLFIYSYLVIVAIYKSLFPICMKFYGRQPNAIIEVLNGVCNNV